MSALIRPRSCAATVLSLALAYVGTATAATPAAAISSESATRTTSSITVHFDDLNLATPAGVRTLQSRLEQAAQVVCGMDSSRDLGLTSRQRACRETAVARAMREIGTHILAAEAAKRNTG